MSIGSLSYSTRREIGRRIGAWCEQHDWPPFAVNNALRHTVGMTIPPMRLERALDGRLAPSEQDTEALITMVRELEIDLNA